MSGETIKDALNGHTIRIKCKKCGKRIWFCECENPKLEVEECVT